MSLLYLGGESVQLSAIAAAVTGLFQGLAAVYLLGGFVREFPFFAGSAWRWHETPNFDRDRYRYRGPGDAAHLRRLGESWRAVRRAEPGVEGMMLVGALAAFAVRSAPGASVLDTSPQSAPGC